MRTKLPMRASAVVPIVVLLSGLSGRAQAPTPPADEHAAFPAGAGRELTLRVCSQCHAPEVAADQQLDEAGWKTLVDQMAGKGATATDAEFDEIVHYLAGAFPAPK